MRYRPITFLTAVNRFRTTASSWLTDEDYPAVVALDSMARQLDRQMTPALVAQFGLVYRNLLSRKPATAAEEDELSRALREAGEES